MYVTDNVRAVIKETVKQTVRETLEQCPDLNKRQAAAFLGMDYQRFLKLVNRNIIKKTPDDMIPYKALLDYKERLDNEHA